MDPTPPEPESFPVPNASAATPEPPPARRPPRSLWRGLLGIGLLVVLLGVLGVAGVVAALGTEAGTRRVLALVPGLDLVGVRGCLLDDFAADRLSWRLDERQTLVLTQLAWVGPRLVWRDRSAPLLSVDRVTLERLDLQGRGDPATPFVLPRTLTLPLDLHIGELRIGHLSTDAIRERPVQHLSTAVTLQAGPAGVHRLDALSLDWDRLSLQGSTTLGASGGLPLDARLTLLPRASDDRAPESPQPTGGKASAHPPALPRDWRIDLRGHGPLTQFSVDARLVAQGQSLDAQAEIRPEQAVPLSHLQARLYSLDLAPFWSGLPLTALTGQIDLILDTRPVGGTAVQRANLAAELTNLRPGRVDQQMVPIQSLKIGASGNLRNPDTGTVDTLMLGLHNGSEAAGTILGSGRWAFSGQGGRQRLDLALSSTLQDLRPSRLDPRAPAMQVSGPLTLTYGQPTGEANSGSTTTSSSSSPAPPHLTLHTDLRGQLTGARLPDVRLLLLAQATPDRLVLEQLEARSGGARLEASGQVEMRDRQWLVRLKGALHAFDPTPWWPGEAQSVWHQGPHRLEGLFDTDLAIPRERPDGVAGLATWRGHASLNIAPSLLAGVPLAGTLKLDTPLATTGGSPRLLAELKASVGAPSGAPDVTELSLQGDLATAGQDDRWQARWHSSALERLLPWLKLAGNTTAFSGDARGEATVQGRWPLVRSTGQVNIGQLKLPAAQQLRDVQARWRLGTQTSDPLALDLTADRWRLGADELSAVALHAQGSAQAHQITTTARLDRPARNSQEATRQFRASATLEGGLQADSAAGDLRWQGQLRPLDVRDAASPASAAALLRLESAPLALASDRTGLSARLGPSRFNLLDGRFTLDEFTWHGAPATQLRLRARLDPLAVAPLLARAQPDFGWSGDLTLGGQISLQATPDQFEADMVLQRLGGDLSVEESDLDNGPRKLGLKDIHLGLSAADGQWRLTQKISGGSLGSLEGQQSVRTNRAAMWPDAADPVTGQIDLRVAQIGQWGRWLPSGWRLSGQIDTEARVGGRFGSPAFSGELQGRQLAVRNVLEGVDWNDAQFKVLLAGETARIESFSVKAGAGTLNLRGDAVLGARPRLSLAVSADRFAVLQRVDRKVVASGTADIVFDEDSTRIAGQLRSDEARFDFSHSDAPSLGDDVDVDRGRKSATGRETAPANPRRNTLDLRIDLGDNFNVRGRGLQTRLAGKLRLTSPAGKLAVQGDIHAEDGTYAAYGQKLRIDRSLISFTGMPDNPRLDVEAIRPGLDDIRVGVTITGTAQNPRVRLFSEPTMSDNDRLSWLIFGRASDGLGRTDLALLQRAAYALIAGESDGPSLIERIGLDQLSVRQDGEGDARETVVTLGKQLTRRWYIGYERSLNAASGNWQLIYRAAQRFTLRAQSGLDNALDLIWTWKWGPPEPVK